MPWYRQLFDAVTGSSHVPSRPANILLWLLRGCFGVLVIGMALFAFSYYSRGSEDWKPGAQAFAAVLAMGVLVVTTDILVRNKQITTISAIYFGLLLGLLLGTLFFMTL